LSFRQVEDILHERGVDICHETVRFWVTPLMRETSSLGVWSTKYLDGIVVGVVMMGLLLLALLSWCYALWKSWKLTRSDKVISAQRLGVFGYLLGAPIFLKFTGIYWLSAMRLITDKLVHMI
jgi:hypothetical protein